MLSYNLISWKAKTSKPQTSFLLRTLQIPGQPTKEYSYKLKFNCQFCCRSFCLLIYKVSICVYFYQMSYFCPPPSLPFLFPIPTKEQKYETPVVRTCYHIPCTCTQEAPTETARLRCCWLSELDSIPWNTVASAVAFYSSLCGSVNYWFNTKARNDSPRTSRVTHLPWTIHGWKARSLIIYPENAPAYLWCGDYIHLLRIKSEDCILMAIEIQSNIKPVKSVTGLIPFFLLNPFKVLCWTKVI